MKHHGEHPCFSAAARRRHGRVHLPVAARCNMQCSFCNRQYDCANESRPGVCSAVLAPFQAMVYLRRTLAVVPRISVVGIAGPGDPLADWSVTRETLWRVREEYPDKLLCIATNGLRLPDYADELAQLAVSHVTVTVNAVQPEIGAPIYRWVRHGKRVLRGEPAVAALWTAQRQGIQALAGRGVTVKVNTVLLPGINECHLSAIAREVAAAGASILNIVPHYPVPGSAFADRSEPTAQQVQKARHEVRGVLPLMSHCTRCRADAAGLLGRTDLASQRFLKACAELPPPSSPPRPHVAVATREGMLVNGHLGQVECLWIYRNAGGVPALVERRPTPPPGGGDVRWHTLGDRLGDCSALFVEALGSSPRQVLSKLGLTVFETQGLIDMTLQDYWDKRLRPVPRRSGSSCSRGGMGCG